MILSHDANSNQPIKPEAGYSYVPELGFVETSADNNNLIQFKGSVLLAFDQENYATAEVRKAAKHLIQLNLKRLLGDQELKSRELFRAYKSTITKCIKE